MSFPDGSIYRLLRASGALVAAAAGRHRRAGRRPRAATDAPALTLRRSSGRSCSGAGSTLPGCWVDSSGCWVDSARVLVDSVRLLGRLCSGCR